MKNLKTLLLLCGLCLSSTQLSAQYYTLKIEEAREIFKIAIQAQACDSLAQFQADEINQWINLYTASDSLSSNYHADLILSRMEINELKEQGNVKDDLTADQKRKKRRWIGIAAAGWGLLIVSAVVGNN